MRASVISLLVAGLLAPFAFAAPAERATVTTPHGERLAANAHEVPKGETPSPTLPFRYSSPNCAG